MWRVASIYRHPPESPVVVGGSRRTPPPATTTFHPKEDRMRTPILPAMLAAALVAACSHESPTMPLALEPSRSASAMGGTQTHGIALVAVLGTGSGAVNVTPTAEDQGT